MVDIYKELQSLKDEFNEKYVSVFDLITHLQNTNENLSKEDVIDWIFIKLRKFNNFQEFFSYDDFNWEKEANNFVLENGIPVYKKRDDGVVCIYDTSTPNLFFEFLIYAKNTKRSLSALEFDMDEWGFKKARAKDLLLNRQMIEKEIGEKIGCVKDEGILEILNAIQLQTKLKRAEDKIKILEEQIVKLQAECKSVNFFA